MIAWVGAPGVNTSATPSSLSSGMSSEGIVPPTVTTHVVDALLLRAARPRAARGSCGRPERIDSPTASASSWITVSTICSGVCCRPV